MNSTIVGLEIKIPNYWSVNLSEKESFNIMPFIGIMLLIHRLNKNSEKRGLEKTEFGIFVPTLISFNQIDEYVKNILEFRKEKNKDKYVLNFVGEFYETKNVSEKKINNLFDYGDNIMRYFRLTRYFKVSTDPLGYYWNIDIEPSRKVEIEQLLNMYSGESIKFKTLKDYLNYLSDITKPTLPWGRKENLQKVAQSLKNITIELIKKENLQIPQNEQEFLFTDVKILRKTQLENYISRLRNLNLELKEQIKKVKLMSDLDRIEEIIETLRDSKKLKKYAPEQFEKLITEALKIINDEIIIKPNYPVDDDGEPVNYSPGNKPDIECYYQTFKAICEVTLNTSKLQWVQEGQPIMRHLRDFEVQHRGDEIFCVFIAPRIHNDTYSQFWISVKYEYNGLPQKIVPLTTEQFALLLELLLKLLKQGRRFNHRELYELYSMVTQESKRLTSFSDWAVFIQKALKDWCQRAITL